MNNPSEQIGKDKLDVTISGDNNRVVFSQDGSIHIEKSQAESETQQSVTVKVERVYENLGRRGIVAEQFKGREDDLDRLHQLLKNNSQVAITAAVTGMGGVGKTELAIQYARKYLTTYQGGVGWFPARDFAIKLVEFARCQFDNIVIPDGVSLEAQVATCWRQWMHGEVLLVIDDVIDYQQEVQPYLPENSRFKALLTSRLKFHDPIESLDLEILQPNAAIELLEFLIGKDKIQAKLEDAKKICEWLGYLPLGLELIGRYVADERLTLAEMLEELQEIRLQHPALEDANYAAMTGRFGLRDALNLSWQKLDQKVRLLACVLSIFALSPIDWQLVERLYQNWLGEDFNKIELRKLRTDLLKRSLLKGQETFGLHQLIREFLRDRLEDLTEKEGAKQAFVKLMLTETELICFEPSLNIVEAASEIVPHLKEITNNLIDYLTDEELLKPFIRLSWFYHGQGLYEEAKPWLHQYQKIGENRYGTNHVDMALGINDLGIIYSDQGNYKQTKVFFERALEIRKQILGEEHPDIAESLDNLASLYCDQGKYEESEPLHLQALAMRKRLLGEEHPDVTFSLNNLATLYSIQGKYEEAEPLFLQALAMRKRLLGEEHPDVAFSLNELATHYSSQGKYEEAEPLFLQALAMRKRLLGEEHPYVALSLNELASLYSSQGKYEEAEPLFLQALAMRKRLLGEEHPYVAFSLNNLATLYSSQGKYEEAEPLFLQALAMRKRLLGEEHPDVARNIYDLAELHFHQEHYNEATPLYKQALELQRNLLNNDHPDIAYSLNNLAKSYCLECRYDEAEPLYIEALGLCQIIWGEEHPNTVKVRENLEDCRSRLRAEE
ncbi:tetratricopeptide repeat protein [Pseudanabaena sp. ABRG5-3]|uniref:tetratricopeptide repeat protein n=1 Tax=Pseudanabaena sp. ABRG5-3 TaxID=685565 RepID=UPI000DC6E582|nr:tetratricopeptide repeat protein [Pseudanabaena sp. ABRG5-3]BBC26623.1 NB-ARC domain-containing protein [Pseudanabaena sp. ABRG5-3]